MLDGFVEVRQIINTLLRWWWIIILGALVGVVGAYAITQGQKKVYEATATVLVGEFIKAPQITRDDIVARDAFVQGYADLALRQPILDKVIASLGLKSSWQQLKNQVSVTIAENTQMIEITAKANTPSDAQAIAGEIANQLILLGPTPDTNDANRSFIQSEIENLRVRIELGQQKLSVLQTEATKSYITLERLNQLNVEIEALNRFITDWEDTYSRLLLLVEPGVTQNSLTIIEEPQANPEPIFPRPMINALIGAMTGLMLALGAIFLVDLLDTKIRSADTLERKFGLIPLGSINNNNGKKETDYTEKIIGFQNFISPQAQSYRTILSKIGYSRNGNQPIKSLLVTNPEANDAKSIAVSNLGVIMAMAGYKTILVDANWMGPIQHLIFDADVESGLMDLLADSKLETTDQLIPTKIENLQLLPIGKQMQNSAEIFKRQRIHEIITDLTKISDIVILDAAPMTDADAVKLSSLVDGVAIVINSGKTTKASVNQSMVSLQLAGSKLLGGILIN